MKKDKIEVPKVKFCYPSNSIVIEAYTQEEADKIIQEILNPNL